MSKANALRVRDRGPGPAAFTVVFLEFSQETLVVCDVEQGTKTKPEPSEKSSQEDLLKLCTMLLGIYFPLTLICLSG